MNTSQLGIYIPDPNNPVDAAPDIKLPPHLKALVFHWAKQNECTPEQQLEKMVQDSARRISSDALLSALVKTVSGDGIPSLVAKLNAIQLDRYGADPDNPSTVIRVSPDGTVTKGRWSAVGEFVPFTVVGKSNG